MAYKHHCCDFHSAIFEKENENRETLQMSNHLQRYIWDSSIQLALVTFERSVPDALRSETNDMLIRYVNNTLWHTSSICWRGIVFAQDLEGQSSSKTNLLEPDLYYHRAGERKTCVYCFSMRIITTKHSGVASV